MGKRIALIQGHPDPAGNRFCHALARVYQQGAEAGGHEVRLIAVAGLDFPLLRDTRDWAEGEAPAAIRQAQEDIAWADHLVIIYPLWMGSMPALLKAFLEQTMRPGFVEEKSAAGKTVRRRLRGKSARIVVTMGMPAWLYRWYFGAHSLKSLERNILRFCGISPLRESLIGLVESPNAAKRERWLTRMRALGRVGG